MKAFGVNGFANNIEYTGNIAFGNGTPAEYPGTPAPETIETNIFAGTGQTRSTTLKSSATISTQRWHRPLVWNMGMAGMKIRQIST